MGGEWSVAEKHCRTSKVDVFNSFCVQLTTSRGRCVGPHSLEPPASVKGLWPMEPVKQEERWAGVVVGHTSLNHSLLRSYLLTHFALHWNMLQNRTGRFQAHCQHYSPPGNWTHKDQHGVLRGVMHAKQQFMHLPCLESTTVEDAVACKAPKPITTHKTVNWAKWSSKG